DGRGIAVVGAKNEPLEACRSTPLGGFRQQPLPGRLIVAAPAQETELVAQQARRDVPRDQRGLDREAARAAHRVDEADRVVAAYARELLPTGAQQHGRGEVLLERRSALRA